MANEVDAHEDPNGGEGERGELVVDGEGDDAEKDETGEGVGHDGVSGSCTTKAGF